MLGDISPQTIRITAQAVVYPGRDHVVRVTVEKVSGQRYVQTDLTDITRAVLVFPETTPTIAYDSLVDPVFDFTVGGGVLEIDLSDYAMPASIYESHLILFDAEHTGGQVIVDNDDTKLVFDFRNVSTTGAVPPPTVEFISEAPIDGVLYGRKDGDWVPITDIVAGVLSVNGQTGIVVLDTDDVAEGVTNLYHTTARASAAAPVQSVNGETGAVSLSAADVGADATGTAAAAVAAHVADTTPHTAILSLDRVGFSLTPAGPAGVGEIVWNDTDKTLDLGLPDGVTLQAGQEVQVRGLNNSGSTMLNGQAVYISGASGNRLVFSKAQANQVTADKTLAVLTQDIANNAQGQATVIGLVRDLNTSGFAEGAELWVSASVLGGLTQTKPAPPNNAVRVGFCVRSHASIGSIFVRVQNIEMLSDLHDLNITNPLDGDIIEYDSATSTWINVPNTGGSGEANTASNLGAGSGVFAQKVGVDLQFKSLVAGSGITLTPTANDITITGSGGGGAVDSVNGQTGVVVLDTDDIAEGLTNLYFTNGRAAAAAPVQSVDGQTGTVSLSASYAPLSHVGDTGTAHGNATISVAGFMSGADKTKLDGVATGANLYVHPNHSGDVTSVGDGAQTIAANAVTNAKAADMAVNTIKGRSTAGTGDPEDLTAAQVRTIINVADGANAYVHPNHSGDVTSVGDGAQTIAANAVSNTKLADMAAQTIKGRTTAGTGDPEDLTAAQVRTVINVANGATALPAVATFTGNKTLALADINTYNVSQDGTAQIVNLQAQATVAWTADAEIHVEQGAAGTVTITGATGVTVNGVSAGSFALAGQFSVVTLKRIGSDSWTLIGGLANSLVSGPASSGDGNIALYNGTTGKVIKDGGTVTAAGLALLDDANAAAQRTTLGLGTGDSPTFTALTLTNGQIVFPATQVPSANANTLDDYEEGTWTPTLTFATPGDLSVTYSASTGSYVKVGKIASITYIVTTSSFTHTTASGLLQITGLPFSAEAAGNQGILSYKGITKAGYQHIASQPSGTALTTLASASGLSFSNVTATDMPSGGSVDLRTAIIIHTTA